MTEARKTALMAAQQLANPAAHTQQWHYVAAPSEQHMGEYDVYRSNGREVQHYRMGRCTHCGRTERVLAPGSNVCVTTCLSWAD